MSERTANPQITVRIVKFFNILHRRIRAVTGHRSDASIDSYNNRPSLKQFQEMSNILSSLVAENEDSSAGKSSTVGSTQVATSPL